MLYSEFEEKTGVSVSAEEFETINNMYMQSDCNKDDFCKLWAKMNHKRVAIAIAERQARRIKDNNLGRVFDILGKYVAKDGFIASEIMDRREIAFCQNIGIQVNTCAECPSLSTKMYDVILELKRYINY